MAAEPGIVVETADGRFCGAVIGLGQAVDAGERRATVVLEDRHGRRREFPLLPAAFSCDGRLVTLVAPVAPAPARGEPPARARTASGSFAVPVCARARRAASRIWVEGLHDAALVERIWGDDLRVAGIVVEPIGGLDNLAAALAAFAPAADRRVGVLADHLVPGSKETRIVADVRRIPGRRTCS